MQATRIGDVRVDPRSVPQDEFLAAARQVRQALYWEKKDLASYVVVATHLLDTALANSVGTTEVSRFFAARSVGLSYDIASLTWSGWDEPGVTVSPALQAAGLEAARLNFKLAQNDQVPDGQRKAAHFILGAQLLAAGDVTEAIDVWSSSPDPQGTRAWILLANVVRGADPAELNALLKELRNQGGDAAETAKQVQAARAVFTPKAGGPADGA
jgi:hypothetical protein